MFFRMASLWPGISRTGCFRGLYPTRQFHTVLERERARSDRSGEEFSLLVLGVKDWETGRETLTQVATFLRRRLRITDEAGWMDDRHIGVVLPGTPAWGAWTVADDLCLNFPDRVPLPECVVFCYPSHWMTHEADRAGAGGELPRRPGRRRPVKAMETLFVRRLPPGKRGLDIMGAGIGLLLLTPLFVLVAAAIKLTSPGPVLFSQMRGGWGGKPFRFFKFRTMVVDAEARKRDLMALNEQDGPAFKIKADPRITTIGRWLRATSIDELPQLWNVLKGDMSLVGPRPLPCDESEACRGWERRRLDVTPGLTCIWQVAGRSRVSFDEWVRMDVRYIRTRSPWNDVKLLLATVPAMVLRKGC
jgi:lipopolysaccharide/colanic/teichoic acid biosynthesis glycosyltransferase